MSDIKQANAMLRMAQRDFKALHGMLDAEFFAGQQTRFMASMCSKPLRNVCIYAHQASYAEGHLAADAPLERENLLGAIGVLVGKVNNEIGFRVSQTNQSGDP